MLDSDFLATCLPFEINSKKSYTVICRLGLLVALYTKVGCHKLKSRFPSLWVMLCISLFNHHVTHSSFQSLIHSFMHPVTHSFIQSLIHSFIHPCNRSKHTFIHPSRQSFFHLVPRSCFHSCIHRSIHSFMQSFIHSFIYIHSSSPFFVYYSLGLQELCMCYTRK